MRQFFQEIKRRNVAKVGIVYLVAGWLTMQVADIMFPALQLPDWMITAVAALIIIGLPFALIFAWAFEMTPEGLKLEKHVDRSQSITPQTGQKLNRMAILILIGAVGLLLVDKFFLQNRAEQLAPVAARPSIAVLPFVNMSDDQANEYFSDGLSEELLNLLAKIPQLHVAGRTSSFKFKGTNEDLRIIGEQLNVDNVLEGSVRKSGPKLRITAQLIDTDNGYHLWSETYDRDLTDIFEIQDEIANNVVAALRVHLLGEQAATSAKGTASTEAYNLFLQGNYFLAHSSAENLKRSVDAYERAIALDPNFARAYAGLSFAVGQQVGGWTGGGGGFAEGFERMRGHAEKAYELEPDSPDALLAMSNAVLNADWDFAANARYNERALGIEPANTNLLEARGFDLLVLGRFEEAEALLTKATEIDPLSVTTHRALGDVQLAAGRFDDAIATYEHALRLSPESARLHERIARAYLFKGDVDAATKHAAEEPVAWVRELVEIMILRRRGDSDAWSRAVADYEARYGHANAYQLAEIYADAGDLDATFEWLSITAAVRDPGGIWGLRSPYFDAARQDPRWSEFRSAFKL